MNIAYLAALISTAIIKIAILCVIICIGILFMLFKGIKKLLEPVLKRSEEKDCKLKM